MEAAIQTKLIEGVKRQVEIFRSILFTVAGVRVGWGKAARKGLAGQAEGQLPVDRIAKGLARELRAG